MFNVRKLRIMVLESELGSWFKTIYWQNDGGKGGLRCRLSAKGLSERVGRADGRAGGHTQAGLARGTMVMMAAMVMAALAAGAAAEGGMAPPPVGGQRLVMMPP